MKRVKDFIGAGSYEDAATALQELLSDPANQNFNLYMTLGQCLTKAGGRDHEALAAFDNALKHESNPPAPVFKGLSELHDRMGNYEESGDSLKRQYEVLKSKGNFAKAVEVGKSVVDRWQKTTKQQNTLKQINKAASFLYSLLLEEWIEAEQSKVTTKEHMSLALRLLDLQYRAVDVKAAAEKGKLSSSSSTSCADASAQELPELDPEGFSISRCLHLIEISTPEDVENSLAVASFKRGVVQHLEGRRRALIQATLGGTRPNSIEVMSLLSAAKRLSRRWAASVVDLCSLVVELWLHLRIEDTYNDDSFNFSFIEAEVNSALESDATHVAANVAVCVHAVERGLAGQTKNSLQVCWSHWNAVVKSASEKYNYIDLVAHAHMDEQLRLLPWIAYVLVVAKGLQGAPSIADMTGADYLHLSQHAIEYLHGHESSMLPVRRDWACLVRLGRVSAIAAAGQVESARAEARSLLPSHFSVDGETNVKSIVRAESDTGNSHGICRMWLSCLFKLRLPLAARELAVGLLGGSKRGTGTPPSYLIADAAYAAIQTLRDEKARDQQGAAVSLWSDSLKHTDLSSLYPADSQQAQQVRIALEDLKRAADTADEYSKDITASLRLRIGETMWLAGGSFRREKACVSSLLASAKADPGQGAVYTLLGHYYHEVGKDGARAAKCYLKALHCDPVDKEGGLALSAMYFAEADEEDEKHTNGEGKEQGERGEEHDSLLRPSSVAERKVLKLWADVTKLSSYAWWAYELRGRYLLQKALKVPQSGDTGGEAGGDLSQCLEAAVSDLQRSLELQDNASPSSWYQLGMAYRQQGQLSSAKAALIRAHELDPRSALPLSLLGSVCLQAAAFPWALQYLNMALEIDPDHVPALKAAAEVSMVRAYEYLQWNWVSGAARSMQAGLVHARRAIACCGHEGGEVKEEVPTCLWKLLGDLLMVSRHVDEADFPSSPTSSSVKDSSRILCMREAEQSYRKVVAAESQPSSPHARMALALAWADVGSSLHAQLSLHYSAGGVGSGLVDQSSFEKGRLAESILAAQKEAVNAFTQGLQVDERCVPCWLGLGKTLDHHDLAAAALSRASQLDPGHGDAHLALALRYLKSGHDEAVDAAVANVQMREGHPHAWILRGLLAERRGLAWEGKDKEREAIDTRQAHDAYRVALEVSKPAEALLGAAITFLRLHGVLSKEAQFSSSPSLSSLQYQHAVCVPLLSFVQLQPIHPTAWTLLGWAWEARSRTHEAADSYLHALRALEVIVSVAEVTEIGLQRANNMSSTILASLLRLLVLDKGRAVPSVGEGEFPHLFRLFPKSMQVAGLLSSVQTDTAIGGEVSSVLMKSCPLLTPAVMTAYLRGDLIAAATGLASAQVELDRRAHVVEYLQTIQRLSVQLDEADGRIFAQACAQSIADAVAPYTAIDDVSTALEAAQLTDLSTNAGTELLFVALSALSVSMDSFSSERGVLLLWGLQQCPFSAILWLALAQHGGGKVHELTSTALLSKGWLVVDDIKSSNSVDEQVWSSERCAEQAIRLSLVVMATSVTGEADVEEDEGLLLWNQNHFDKPLYNTQGLSVGPAYCLGHALSLLNQGNVFQERSFLLKAAHQWPCLLQDAHFVQLYDKDC